MLIAMTAPRTPRPARRLAVASAAVGIAVALPLLAACGGSSGGSAGGKDPLPATPSVTLIGTDNKFDAKQYSAPAGSVGFAYYNKGNVSHSLVIKAADGTRFGKRLLLAPGREGGLTVDLAAGTYELYCDVAGHKESGMDATLTLN